MRLNILLWDVASDMNIGLAIRDCYILGGGIIHLLIFDPSEIVQQKQDGIRRFSSYASDHFHQTSVFRTPDDALEAARATGGRLLGTTPHETNATDLSTFMFRDGDVIAFGNEYVGLPQEFLAQCELSLVIPMFGRAYLRPDAQGRIHGNGVERCHSLATSISVTTFLAVQQLTKFANWRRTGSLSSDPVSKE